MFSCERCGYETERKGDLMKHLKRKKECSPLLSSITPKDIIAKLEKHYEEGVQTFDCIHCLKKFNTKSNMTRHASICKSKPQEPISDIEMLKKEVKQLKEELQIQKETNKGNVTNIISNNNYNINNYGNESLDHLPNDFLTSCFMFKNMPSLIENIHFDPDCPRNKNIQLKSLKHKLIKVYQDEKWNTKPADNVLDELVNKGQTILKKHFRDNRQEVEEEMSTEEIDEVVDWLAQIFEDNEKIRRPLKQELLALLDNYR